MTEKRKLVMATNNAGKLREARAIAGDRLDILSLNDIGFHQDIEETADTLAGNALIKVRAIKDVCDLDVFADDTGLMVDALGGAPGVYSARYAGEGCTPDQNIDLLLKNLERVEDRSARFRTCIALSLDGKEHLFDGAVEGHIGTHRSGDNGFGYDPIFVCEETGKCFAEMTDDEKNAISHRGRAISAMMKWLASLCIALFAILPSTAASSSSDWTLYNTFDDKIDKVFDTPEKTYFLVQAQAYVPDQTDNNTKLCFLFVRDKEGGEMRPYNVQNFLSSSLIRMANYNAQKKYLLIVYDNLGIDMLYDDGKAYYISALKNFDSSSTKEVRSISFDPEQNRAYLATDFGFVAINDDKHEVASSGIYNRPIDYIARIGNRLLAVADGNIYSDNATSNHLSFSDFKPTDWTDGEEVLFMTPLSSKACIISRKHNGTETHFSMTWPDGQDNPVIVQLGTFLNADFYENNNGILVSMPNRFVAIDRNSAQCQYFTKREQDYGTSAGSWDLKDFHFAMPREGFYSLRKDSDGGWTVTGEAVTPNAPAPFRSNNLLYSTRHGMLTGSHGIDQNFSSHLAPNPVLLSGLSNGEWSQMGVPYFDDTQSLRVTNPSGMAQDPDNPDVFYFGSVMNGLLRYNIRDFSSLMHMTSTTDSPSLPGHVSVREPHSFWSNSFMLLSPVFDKNGNLLVGHVSTESNDGNKYTAELWIWSAEKRKASTSPESFKPFTVAKINGTTPSKSLRILPFESSGARNALLFFPVHKYNEPFVVYDHNGTPDDVSDDRQVAISNLSDSDGTVSFHYIHCATEDPSTGLVWVGTDNGVFYFNPMQQFTNPGSVSRIKVSRNDGTSLADYLLDGISVNNISIDGKGRKWFSLNGGGLVCTSADGRTILNEITTDNSMLPSDNVYATCYNPDRNSLMVATEGGLAEYHFNGQNSAAGSDVRVYPNPVRPDYYGWVTIEGLEDDCIVKITDSAGNLVRELGPASGGKVLWDASNARLDRVASGVYFVLASSGPDGGSYSEVAKVLVMKQ